MGQVQPQQVLVPQIVEWLRLNCKPWYGVARVIEVLCRLRDDQEANQDTRLLGKVVAHLPLEEVRQLILAPKKERTRLAFRTLYSALARSGDILNLLKADLFDGGRVFFRGGKGDIDRYGLLDAGTEKALQVWLDGQPLKTRPCDLSHPGLSKAFEAACKSLGLLQKYDALDQRLSPHVLRHNSSTHCFEREMQVTTVQALLGHAELENTDTYIHRSLQLCRERFLRAPRRPLSDLMPAVRGEGALEEVVQFILAGLPPTADLDAVIDALCEHRLKTVNPDELEFIAELKDELGVDEIIRGDRLPLVVSRREVAELVTAATDPLDATLYGLYEDTGMQPEEPFQLAFTDLDPRELTIRTKDRLVVAHPATFESLRTWQGDKDPAAPIFPITVQEAERRLQQHAQRTGLLERYQAMERNLTLRVFRHAFGSNRIEDGLDVLTLKALMGHTFAATTTMYLKTSVGRYRAEYDRCHPLANGELELAPTPFGE